MSLANKFKTSMTCMTSGICATGLQRTAGEFRIEQSAQCAQLQSLTTVLELRQLLRSSPSQIVSGKLSFGTGKWTDSCPECELPSFDLSTGVSEICGHVGDIEND